MKKVTLTSGLVALALFSVSAANAAPYIVNVSLDDIDAVFGSVVSSVDSELIKIPVVPGQNVFEFTDSNGNAATVTVTRPDGVTPPTLATGYSDYGYTWGNGKYTSNGMDLSGSAWNINPYWSYGDPIPGFNSGLTFTFSSPVNAFGFEVGDWATCCFDVTRPDNIVKAYGVPATGSGLWIAFDGGAATLPANALAVTDNPGYEAYQSTINFIGAIDSSGTFTSITFFGDGFGEVLAVGGMMMFGLVPLGSVDEDGAIPGIPEPETWAMLLAGLGIVGAAAKRRRRQG